MDENEVLDASSIDEMDDFDLTGEIEDDNSVAQEDSSDNSDNSNNSDNSQSDYYQETNEEIDKNEDFTAEVLRLKGISDPSRIKFEDESGAIVERDWNSLTDTERLNILARTDDPERDLEEDEIVLINALRENQLTPQQYIQALQQQAYQQAVQQFEQAQTPTYDVDSLSDDELFALDLLEKVGEENITDEELQEALDQAKANPYLFEKQVEGLRATYQQLEDQQRYETEQAEMQAAEMQYQDFSQQVLEEISGFNSLMNQDIELSTEDKNDIANYMLTRRESGVSDFYTDIQDPAVATMAAFLVITWTRSFK